MRSPVNNVLAVLDLIDLSKIKDQESSELLNLLKLSGERLKEMMDNYVDSLSEKHNMLANVEEVDLSESLGESKRQDFWVTSKIS